MTDRLTLSDLLLAKETIRRAPIQFSPPNPVHLNEKAHLVMHDGGRVDCLQCARIWSKALG